MPIGSSDGEQYGSEYEQLAQSVPQANSPYTEVPKKELDDLLWDTPIFKHGAMHTPSELDEMLRVTPEQHQKNMDDWNSFAKEKNAAEGREMIGPQTTPMPAGRMRGNSSGPGVQEYLKKLPDDVEAIDAGDGTVIFRLKAKDKPPLTSENDTETLPLPDAALSTLFLVPATKVSRVAQTEGVPGAMRYGGNGLYHMIHAESGTYAGFANLEYDAAKKNVNVVFVKNSAAARSGLSDLGRMELYKGGLDRTVSLEAKIANNKSMSIGPAELYQSAGEIKRVFPEAETISGFRISGAREKAYQEAVKSAVENKTPLPSRRELEVKHTITRPLPEPAPTPSGRILPPRSATTPGLGAAAGYRGNLSPLE